MKYLTLVLLCSAFLFACKNDKGTLRDSAGSTPTTTTPTPTTTAPSATGVVFHYICPNNCANSGGDAAGTCPVCGTAYQHNQAYHSQQTTTTTTPSTNNNGLSPIIQQPSNPGVVPPTVNTPEPAQNVAGVWHYTCPSGCAGGGGSAVACSSCGSTLQHNTAYHN
ncbi:MAG: hypothetical protein KJP00_11825 [Bacteroidia bacterium]|nr:hypothetical protein [Bacteroidia bacterium]